jgi:ketosteroid isomerase-like protein
VWANQVMSTETPGRDGEMTMSAEDNLKTIKMVYEAFARGDVQAIAEAVSDDVDWAADTTSTVAPWYGVRRSKADVAEFFEAFGSTMEVEEFTPISFAANDTDVLTVVRFRVRARATGRTAAMHLHHYFVFRDGKIAYYRGSEDSAQTVAILQA